MERLSSCSGRKEAVGDDDDGGGGLEIEWYLESVHEKPYSIDSLFSLCVSK